MTAAATEGQPLATPILASWATAAWQRAGLSSRHAYTVHSTHTIHIIISSYWLSVTCTVMTAWSLQPGRASVLRMLGRRRATQRGQASLGTSTTNSSRIWDVDGRNIFCILTHGDNHDCKPGMSIFQPCKSRKTLDY